MSFPQNEPGNDEQYDREDFNARLHFKRLDRLIFSLWRPLRPIRLRPIAMTEDLALRQHLQLVKLGVIALARLRIHQRAVRDVQHRHHVRSFLRPLMTVRMVPLSQALESGPDLDGGRVRAHTEPVVMGDSLFHGRFIMLVVRVGSSSLCIRG